MTLSNEAKTTMGTLTLDFSTNVSRKVLEEQFNDFMVKMGAIKLVNSNDEVANLEIMNHEFTVFDENEDF